MRWRLSKDSFTKNDAEFEKKPGPLEINGENITIKNDIPPQMLTENTSVGRNFRYSLQQSANNQIMGDYKPRLSMQETNKTNSPRRYKNNETIYVITSDQTVRTEPWMTPSSASMTKTTVNDSNLSAVMLDNYASETNNDFHYINSASNPSNAGSLIQNGSTSKLIPSTDDQSTKQTKCSILRGLLLCFCLNLTYANVVRFPRELERHGCAYLIPYIIILFLVGLPIILLEVSIGQFLGQGAANSWKSSPILKGSCVIGRMASCLGAIWVSLEATIALVYIAMFSYKTVPFSECITGVKIIQNEYRQTQIGGHDCLIRTILTPVWDYAFYFALLASGLVLLWIISALSAHNAKVFRRMTIFFGVIGGLLLIALTGWEVDKSLKRNYFPQIWVFDETIFGDSGVWFDALVQVLFGVYIGVGALPVMTGKFLYKGDAVRTSVVYLCLNLLINAIAVTLFMVQFDNNITRNSSSFFELKPLTAIYDNVLTEAGLIATRIMPGLVYAVIVISAIVTMTISIFSISKLIPRHTGYLLALLAVVVSICSLVCPDYMVARVLDSRIVGTIIIIALVFDLIGTTWIYGAKNIYLDLEFAIGHSILKSWLVLWCLAPVTLTGILVWWCVGDDQADLLHTYIPRWAPIIFALAIIVIAACVEISKQVDYNFFGMICEAAKAAKEWGPADPLARHAWKQWRSVCQDTGRKDFTLRRRGTRDYTHSIKRGQYSTAKYGVQNWKNSTTGNSSPNYSGSVFGDSAIEEDLSVGKYSGVNQQLSTHSRENTINKPMRYSSRARKISHEKRQNHGLENHKEVVYVRRSSGDNMKTMIKITPGADIVSYPKENPRRPPVTANSSKNDTKSDGEHICWRKFSINSEEYSTEL